MLKRMPEGKRGFILRDFDVDVDPSRNPADGRSLWWQHGVAGALNKTRGIAEALKQAGISHVDFVLMDFEVGMSKSFLDGLNDTALAAMPDDPRFAAGVAARLKNLTDIVTGLWPSPPAQHAMPLEIRHGNWDTDCYRWNDLSRVRVADFLTAALAQPLAEAWLGVEVSNYGASRAAGTIIPDVNGHPECRYAVGASAGACGAVVGTDSFSMYGTFGQLELRGWQNNPNSSVFPTVYNATASNAYRLVVNRARAAALAQQQDVVGGSKTSAGGLHVWVQPKEMVIGTSATPLACAALITDPSAHCESGTFWEEAVIHVAMSGVTAFGFWGTPAAGATSHTDLRLSSVLSELDGTVGAADRSPHEVSIIDWLQPRALVVSSMSLENGTLIAHRVVCLRDGAQLSAAEQADGSVKVACDGAETRHFPHSRVLKLASPVSPMGRWVLQTVHM